MSENNKKKTKHSLIALLLFVLLTVTLSIGGTLAYFTHMDADTNKLQVGYNEIAIEENFEPPAELTSGDNVFKKQVQITNTGNVDCYVRVFLEFSEGNIDNMSKLSADGTNYYSSEEYKTTNTPDGWVYVSREEDPVLGDYYYYKEPLAPGESTTYLLDSVKTTFPTAEDVDDFEIIVYSESVQTLDKNGKPFEDPDAWEKCWDEFIDYVYEEPVIYHTVTFNATSGYIKPSADESGVRSYTVKVPNGTPVSRPANAPFFVWAEQTNDMIFDDWYTEDGSELYDFTKPVTSDITIKAKWIDIYKVNFDANGGTIVHDGVTDSSYHVNVQDGKTIEETINEPEYEGKTFLGWYDISNDELFDFSKPITRYYSLMAKWEDLIYHEVKFISEYGYPFIPAGTSEEVTEYTMYVLDGEKVPVPTVEPTFTKGYVTYTFDCWQSTLNPIEDYDFDTPVKSDLELVLSFSSDSNPDPGDDGDPW